LSEGLFFSGGIPVSAQGPEIYNAYGDGTIWLRPRGSQGRTPSYWSLDLHAHYDLPVFRSSGSRRLTVVIDAFNVFDRQGVLEVDTDYVYQGMPNFDEWQAESNLDSYGNPTFKPELTPSRYYRTPTLYQRPRSLHVGLKLAF
jgi:hypothetical protein